MLRLLKLSWALPCSLIGLLAAVIPLSRGGQVRWTRGALEVIYRPCLADCGARALALPFRAMVLGHVILAVSDEELQRLGPHERVHVAQYERWGDLYSCWPTRHPASGSGCGGAMPTATTLSRCRREDWAAAEPASGIDLRGAGPIIIVCPSLLEQRPCDLPL